MSGEMERLNGIIRQKGEEIDQYRLKISEWESSSHHHEHSKKSAARDKEGLLSEIQRLTLIIEQKDRDLQDWRQKYS